MEIRKGTEQDIPSIVALLRESLGEDLMPKSEEYWRWKHVVNPFGPSPVLLAFDDSKLVGVRAFMRWQWRYDERFFESVRAVDTATHPDYQGRGIFKKLTLAMLDYCKNEEWHFVFNTPNKKSKPGYLKMGWQEAGKLPIQIQLFRPLSMTLRIAGLKRAQKVEPDDNSVSKYLQHPGIENLLRRDYKRNKKSVVTAHSLPSLSWRYRDVTVAQYGAFKLEKNNELHALIFYRIKPSHIGREMRITDVFMDPDVNKKRIYESILEKVKIHQADYVTISGMSADLNRAGLLNWKKLPVGPMVTIRNITYDATDILDKFKVWNPSVGDLELF